MPKKSLPIPINHFAEEHDSGISIERPLLEELITFREAEQAHRHDRHSFFLLEQGSVAMDIDFEKHLIKAPSVIYMHPDQVHLITAFEDVRVSSWALNNENLNPKYLELLQGITPAPPLALDAASFALFCDAVALGLRFSARQKDKLYHSLLKDSCNALVALVIAHYSEGGRPADMHNRHEVVTKAFKGLLERDYTTAQRPAAYAQKLNISTSYLNECVKNTTGHPVSYHIQQRVILEAKRMLYHTDRSVKEIAAALGYDDQPYFSRLFNKLTGMSALAFRRKNHD